MGEFRLETARLALRDWHEADRAPFAALNADPVVMEFFPKLFTRAESDALVDNFQAELEESGYCPWAVEERLTGTFIGFVGLHAVPPYMPFGPGAEVGWRLARPYWGQGYATEAVLMMAALAWRDPAVTAVTARTESGNAASRRVLEKAWFRPVAAAEEISYRLPRPA